MSVPFPLDAENVWCEITPTARSTTPRGALFLDRDGVVVEEADYLSRVADLSVIAGAAETIAQANARGVPVVLVTNQAGIGRGYYTWSEFATVQTELAKRLASQKAHFDAVYACAHHPEGQGVFAHPNHPARKPNPGMIQRAAAALSLDLTQSWLVGDKAIDIAAAKNAGLAGAMLALTGYGMKERAEAEALRTAGFDVRVGASIKDALTLPILR